MALTTGERQLSSSADPHVKPYPERDVEVYADTASRRAISPARA
jgi:hypothetical protein